MIVFRLWCSKDSYYISEPEARRMGHERAQAIVRHYSNPRLSMFATEQELSAPIPYYQRVFEYELFGAPAGPLAERFAESVSAGASLILQERRLQHYRYGEISEQDWELMDRGLKEP